MAVALALTFYVCGPAVTPAMRAAAFSSCNRHVTGDFRSFHVAWRLGWHPHWACWDVRDPGTPATDLGWWARG